MKKILVRGLIVILVLGALAGGWVWYNFFKPEPDYGRKVLVFSKTDEFRHESIPAGIEAITRLGKKHRFNVEASEDSSLFNQQKLAEFQAVVFLNTTGDVLDNEQQEAFQRYIQAGGGFVGIHAAADTEWKGNLWPWYTRLVGGAFLSHPSNPNVQSGTVNVTDGGHPATEQLPAQFSAVDEWYSFHRFNSRVNVLLELDSTSFQGSEMGDFHPIAWYHNYDGGRSFYTGQGHTDEAFARDDFLQHLAGGIRWAIGDGELDYSKAAPESWRMKRVILDSGLDEPMMMAFTPAGDLYYIQRKGELMRFDIAQSESQLVAKLDVYSEGENGLIGITFDPGFEQNNWIYLFASRETTDGFAHTLSRFELKDDVLDQSTELVVLRVPITPGRQAHTGGALQFDQQGNLWITTGDNTNPHESNGYSPHDDRPGREGFDAARSSGNTQDLRGKALRITPQADGSYSIPEGNLFADAKDGRPEIYVMGLRNPFRSWYDDKTGYFYWGEVGPDAKEHSDTRGPWGYDEFNRTNKPGNFGWPLVIGNNEPYARHDFSLDPIEGESDLAGAETEDSPVFSEAKPEPESLPAPEFIDPAAPQNLSANNTGASILPPAQAAWMYYPYEVSEEFIELGEGGRTAMAGGVYYYDDYPENPAKLPPYFDNKLFIYDWVRRWIKTVTVDEQGNIAYIKDFMPDNDFSAPIDFEFAPDGSLYVLEYGSAWFSRNDDAYISRLEYYGAENPPPVAKLTATKTAGAIPLQTELSATDSFDRNGPSESLTYRWELIENGLPVASLGEAEVLQYTAETAGEHKVRLTVIDADGATAETGVVLEAGNEPPTIEIQFSNGNGSFYWDNEGVDYKVVVEDLEDGSTEDGSIAAHKVMISLDYIAEGLDLAGALVGHQGGAGGLDGNALIEGSDCSACHTRDKASVGPSYAQLSERYEGSAEQLAELASKVLDGGAGNWGEHAMSPHPQHSREEALEMVAAMLGVRSGLQAEGLPLAGGLVFDQHQANATGNEWIGSYNAGRYLLTASYTDAGAQGAINQSTRVSKLIRFPKLGSDDFDETFDAMAMPAPIGGMEGFKIMIFRGAEGLDSRGYARLDQVDLAGVAKIRVAVATSKMFTTGGKLSVYLDSISGQPLGTLDIENKNIGKPDSADFYELELPDIEGLHDLYIVADEVMEGDKRKPLYIFVVAEFVRG